MRRQAQTGDCRADSLLSRLPLPVVHLTTDTVGVADIQLSTSPRVQLSEHESQGWRSLYDGLLAYDAVEAVHLTCSGHSEQ